MENKRKAILDTATELFSANGYHAVGIDRIIADAGVAKMTMYRHFPSKNCLVVEVLKVQARVSSEFLSECVAGIDNPEAQLKAVFRWHDRWFHTPSFHGCMFAHAASEFNDKTNEIHQVSAAQKQQFAAFVRDVLKCLTNSCNVCGARRAAARLEQQCLGIRNEQQSRTRSRKFVLCRR